MRVRLKWHVPLDRLNATVHCGGVYEVTGFNNMLTHYQHRDDHGELIWNRFEFFEVVEE